jgi:alanine racemase
VLAVNDGRAVIAAGSADGVPPSVLGPSGSGAWVLLGGVRREIVEIGIDTLEVDLGEGEARPGDVATLFGAGDDGEPTAEEWAGWAGTVGDEIVARASTRGERVLRG